MIKINDCKVIRLERVFDPNPGPEGQAIYWRIMFD